MLRGEEAKLVDESDSMLEVELLRELFADQHLLRTNLSLTLSLATLKLNSVTLRTGCVMPASVEICFLGFLLISSTGHQLPVSPKSVIIGSSFVCMFQRAGLCWSLSRVSYSYQPLLG